MIPRFRPQIGLPEIKVLFKANVNAVKKFEMEFAKTFSAVDAVAFPYGRSAQWAFFKALNIKNGEVIMPAYTCSVVAHAVILSGNIPKFVDIKSNEFNMDMSLLKKSINKKTKAIIATHTFGYPENIRSLEKVVKIGEKKFGNKIWLIQDCCHAFSAKWKGKAIGASGDVAIYSSNISKILTSIYGGMLTFQDEALARKVRFWRDQYFKKPSFLKSIKRRVFLLLAYLAFKRQFYFFTWWLQEKTDLLKYYTDAFHLDDKVHFPPDYLDFMLNVEAAVGLKQLARYNDILELRKRNTIFYNSLLKKMNWCLPPLKEGATYSHYVVRVSNREKIINDFAKKGLQLGRLIEYSIPNLESYKKLGSDCPNSLIASKETINLPLTISKEEKTIIKDLFLKL